MADLNRSAKIDDETLSVGTVIDDLARYDRQEVVVRGFLAVQFENVSIADDHRQDSSRRLWVKFHYASLGTREKDMVAFDRKTVVAKGIIKHGRSGHFRSCPATLNIRSLRLA